MVTAPRCEPLRVPLRYISNTVRWSPRPNQMISRPSARESIFEQVSLNLASDSTDTGHTVDNVAIAR